MKKHILYVTRYVVSAIILAGCSMQGSIQTKNTNSSGEPAAFNDPNLVSTNIKNGVTIFGIMGTYIGTGSFQQNMASNAPRDAGVQVVANMAAQPTSQQISLDSELNVYKNGASLPNTAGFNYRDIPDNTKDDEGLMGTSCKYAPRPSNNCGTTQGTISARIADCATQNPTTSSWNGATQCNGGEGQWKLVTRNGANKEVWQDQRTGLLWSSLVSGAGINWCQGSGNTQMAPAILLAVYNNAAGTAMSGSGTIGALSGGSSAIYDIITIKFTSATAFNVTNSGGASGCTGGTTTGGLTTTAGSTVTYSRAGRCSFTITQGATNFAVNDTFEVKTFAAGYSCFPGAASGMQPASPISYCAESAGLNAPPGEVWASGTYMTAKGGMGKTVTASSPSVSWRMPTVRDYKLGEVNGLRFVMPDMGVAGSSRPSPDGSVAGAAEWTGSLFSYIRNYPWYIAADSGAYGLGPDLNNTFGVRCVGR